MSIIFRLLATTVLVVMTMTMDWWYYYCCCYCDAWQLGMMPLLGMQHHYHTILKQPNKATFLPSSSFQQQQQPPWRGRGIICWNSESNYDSLLTKQQKKSQKGKKNEMSNKNKNKDEEYVPKNIPKGVTFPGKLIPASRYSSRGMNDDVDDDDDGSGEEVFYRLGKMVSWKTQDGDFDHYPNNNNNNHTGGTWHREWLQSELEPLPPTPYKYSTKKTDPTIHVDVVDQLGHTWKSAAELQQIGLTRKDLPQHPELTLTTTVQQRLYNNNNQTINITLPLPWDSSSTKTHNTPLPIQHDRLNPNHNPPHPTDIYNNKDTSNNHSTSHNNNNNIMGLPNNSRIKKSLSATADVSSKLRKKASSSSSSRFELDEERWLSHYSNLVQYKADHGHTNVPKDYQQDPTLGRWVNRQRAYYATYVRNYYYPYNVTLITTLNHTHDTTTTTTNNTRTKKTVTVHFGKKLIPLTPWRIQMLYDLGFKFRSHKLSWMDRYKQLKLFYQQNNHTRCFSTTTTADDDDDDDDNNNLIFAGLYEWTVVQRAEYRKFQEQLTLTTTSTTNQLLLLKKKWKRRKELLDKLQFQWDPQQTAWDTKLQQFSQFQQKHRNNHNDDNTGNTDDMDDDDDASLRQWLKEQRFQYKIYHSDEEPWESTLTPQRIQQLDDLQMDWNPMDSKWENKFNEYKQYILDNNHNKNNKSNNDDHGNMDDSSLFASIAEQNSSLGYWIRKQRLDYKAGKLSMERQQKLIESGFILDMYQDYTFDRGLNRLKLFIKEFGHANVPKRYKEIDPQLWSFVDRQRQLYNSNNDNNLLLSSGRQQRLEELGFVFNVHEAVWEDGYNKLVHYVKVNGHCHVPSDYQDDKLYQFVAMQRAKFREGKLSKERMVKLNSIGFIWNTLDALWNERLNELAEYQKQHGDCLVPTRYPTLGPWVRRQRAQKKLFDEGKKSTITEERIQLLDQLGFTWTLS